LELVVAVTLAVIGSPPLVSSLYWTKLPTLIFAGNSGFALVTVLELLVSLAIFAAPTKTPLDWTTSALKVLIPITPLFVPYTDFTSDNVCAVTATAILPLPSLIPWEPLNINASFLINSPLVSYIVNSTPLLTALLKNPVAPLLAPLT